MQPQRILLFGDGAWASHSLVRLAADHQLVGVVLRRHPSEPTLAATAQQRGIAVLQPRQVNHREFVDLVRRLTPDIVVSLSYDQILRRPLLDVARYSINVHAGKLPQYRGRNVINWAIINGEHEIGVTVHLMDEGIDTGDIVLQICLPIGWTDSYGVVHERVVAAIPPLLAQAVQHLATGTAQPQPQAHLPGSYFAARGVGDEWLDWTETSSRLHNKIRAISRPGPGAQTLLNQEVVRIWAAFYDHSWPGYIATPGQVVGRDQCGVVVKTGDSTLLVSEVQVGAAPPLQPAWPIGTRLGVNLGNYVHTLQTRLAAYERALPSNDDKNQR